MVIGQDVSDLSQKFEQNAKQEQEMKNLANSINTLTTQTREIDSYFVAPDGDVDFIDQLENTAKVQKLDVQTNSVSIDSPKDLTVKGLQYLVLKLNTKGSWLGTYKFLSIIPNLPYKINLDQADITLSSDKGITPPVWQGSFTIRVLKKSK